MELFESRLRFVPPPFAAVQIAERVTIINARFPHPVKSWPFDMRENAL
jgi:hypothetical protein